MYEILSRELGHGFCAITPTAAALRLVLAALLGGLIGFEREMSRKPAGLRTHILVAVAACLFILVSQELATLQFGDPEQMRVDPLRLVEAVTAGVAFLGAGAIFRSDGQVKNITTGASMWLAGAIGLACGSGQLLLATMTSVLIVTIISGLGWIERRLGPK